MAKLQALLSAHWLGPSTVVSLHAHPTLHLPASCPQARKGAVGGGWSWNSCSRPEPQASLASSVQPAVEVRLQRGHEWRQLRGGVGQQEGKHQDWWTCLPLCPEMPIGMPPASPSLDVGQGTQLLSQKSFLGLGSCQNCPFALAGAGGLICVSGALQSPPHPAPAQIWPLPSSPRRPRKSRGWGWGLQAGPAILPEKQ